MVFLFESEAAVVEGEAAVAPSASAFDAVVVATDMMAFPLVFLILCRERDAERR